jgi:cbb3-type cytochrome oxidase subunit 3
MTTAFAIAFILKEGASHVQNAWIGGVVTFLCIGAFLAWTWYALDPRRQALLDQAARLPLDDDGGAP